MGFLTVWNNRSGGTKKNNLFEAPKKYFYSKNGMYEVGRACKPKN